MALVSAREIWVRCNSFARKADRAGSPLANAADYVWVRCDVGHALWPLIGRPKPLVGAATRPLRERSACLPMKRRSRGFTLMELMITVAVAAAIFALGVPAFREFGKNGRL